MEYCLTGLACYKYWTNPWTYEVFWWGQLVVACTLLTPQQADGALNIHVLLRPRGAQPPHEDAVQ